MSRRILPKRPAIKRHTESLSHDEAGEVFKAIAGLVLKFLKEKCDLGQQASREQEWARERTAAQQPDAD